MVMGLPAAVRALVVELVAAALSPRAAIQESAMGTSSS
jgi:hypothetical protein